MAQSSDEEQRRRRRRRLVQGLFVGGAAVGVPALLNSLVARQVQNLPDMAWGTGDVYRWQHGDVAYQRLGDGPPLVLLHAFGPGHSSAEWRQAAEELAPSFEVFALDLPGWGQSSEAGTDLDADLYLQLLDDFLRHVVGKVHPGRPAVLVAAGLSAAYAAQAAVELPSHVAGLALVAPTGLASYSSGPEMRDAVLHSLLRLPVLGTSALNVFTSRTSIGTYLRRDVFGSPDLVDDTLVDQHYFNGHRPGAQQALAAYVAGYLNPGYLNRDLRDTLAKVEQPVWIAWGRRAVNPPVEAADLWMRSLPEAQLEVFEQAGILPHAESPGEFGRKLESFVSDHVLTA